MTKCISRNELIYYLPNGICAEIGVAKGKFSKHILKSLNPKKFYLIDSWEHFDLGYADGNMVSQEDQDSRYYDVVKKFQKFQNVEIIRKRSIEALKMFSDNYFDWVYIDADHSYDGCFNDLMNVFSKVKDGGLICGHDYLEDGFNVDGFGVNAAVHDFIKLVNFELIYLTDENKFKSYVLGNQDSKKKFLDKINEINKPT